MGYDMNMKINDRVAQWENMTQADPDNDMGWFSLGSAYKDADRPEDAAGALEKAIQLNPGMSRAYQLLGGVLIQLGRDDEAGRVLTQGYTQAAQRGDVMPLKAMGSLLEKLGLPIPQAPADRPSQEPVSGDTVIDRRTGQPGRRLPDPPMPGALGQFIFDHFSQETWREWLAMGTKVINELRLDFSNEEHQRVYEQHMMEWLGISHQEVQDHASSTK